MASLPQFWDWLKNRRGKDDKVSRKLWKAVKTKTKETRVAKPKGRREKRRRRRRKWEEKKQKKENKRKKEEDNRNEEAEK